MTKFHRIKLSRIYRFHYQYSYNKLPLQATATNFYFTEITQIDIMYLAFFYLAIFFYYFTGENQVS